MVEESVSCEQWSIDAASLVTHSHNPLAQRLIDGRCFVACGTGWFAKRYPQQYLLPAVLLDPSARNAWGISHKSQCLQPSEISISVLSKSAHV